MLASLCLGLAACASTPNQPPSLPHSQLGGADYDHVSRAVGVVLDRQLAPDNGAPRTLANIAQGTPPPWLGKNAQSGLWIGDLLGIHLEIDVGCSPACGPGVDGAHATFDIAGTLNLLIWQGTFDVTAETSITGLSTPVYSFDAGAKITLGSSFNAFGVTYSSQFAIDASSDLTGSTLTMVPISGRGTLALTYDRTRSDTGQVERWDFDVDASIAGTIASFTIDGIGYQIDLSTGIITRV